MRPAPFELWPRAEASSDDARRSAFAEQFAELEARRVERRVERRVSGRARRIAREIRGLFQEASHLRRP